MHTKELVEKNYMEALLRAALLLGDAHRNVPICEITIAGFHECNHVRKLYPRCRIHVQADPQKPPVKGSFTAAKEEYYLLLYPHR